MMQALGVGGEIALCGGGMLSVYWPDGNLKWRSSAASFNTTPVIDAAGRIYVWSFAAGSGALHCLNTDGTTAWSSFLSGYVTAAPAISEDGLVYCGDYTGRFVAINATSVGTS